MKIEIDRDTLLGAVRAVVDVVPGRTTIPVLANILLVASQGQLAITGTDLDIEATATVEVAGDLRVTIEAQKLVAAVSSFKPGRLTMEMTTDRGPILMKQGRGQRTLGTIGAEDFPKRNPLEGATAFSMSPAALLRLLDATHIAQSTEETRYYLNGVFLHVVEGKLRAVATDGHRLVRAEVSAPDGADGLPDIIVPTKCVTLLRKLLPKQEGDVGVEVTNKAIALSVGPVAIICKLVDGTFPDYARVIPTSEAHILTLARDGLIEPVRAVAAVVNAEGDQKVRTVVLEIGTDDAHEVSAKDTMGSSASEPLDCAATGGAIRLGLNHKYLSSVAAIFSEAGVLSLSFADAAAPVRVESDKDGDLLAVIMPMRA